CLEYSDPGKILRIPFPLWGATKPERFDITDDGSFDYFGREKFAEVLVEIEKLNFEFGFRALYVYGTIGYGKSHILAAMTCLLLRQGKRVVYLPDCRAMLTHFLNYIKSGLLLAFGDSESHQLKIQKCISEDEISLFCDEITVKDHIRLYFIVDQMNALDDEYSNKDCVSNIRKDKIRTDLDKITSLHYVIESASANFKSAMHMQQKQLGKLKLPLIGGLTETEMPKWWDLHEKLLPKLNDDDKKKVEDITGRIPLLLGALLMFHGKDFKSVESDFLLNLDYVNVQVENFADIKKNALNPLEWNS
ncbi:hypothetical protein BC937DRAFT_86882, partial [Endogone sp. FLAS-F59071]